MSKKIIRPRPQAAVPAGLASLHPVLARVYAARGVADATALDRSLKQLQPAQSLRGLDTALDLLQTALEQQQRLLVIGDFDTDGATSTALSVLALRAMGATIDYLVPNRFQYGYGLTPEIVAVAARDKQPDLIITVDNGIASLEGVAAAHQHGIRVLVTDHHLPGRELPEADAIVNPNQPGCPFPSKHLAGVGVVFYLLSALRTRLKQADWFARAGIAEPVMADYLDLVALGTVADVVPLDHNNRVLVQQGMARIRAGRCRPGIVALLAMGKREPARLLASDLGFAVAPRLNAAGRLDDMRLGIECLLASSEDRANVLASELDRLNQERREIESGMQEQALLNLRQIPVHAVGHGVTLFDPGWHQGVIGIVAGRMKERLHRPVVVFAPAGEGQELKGSARSIAGVHIRDALEYVATRQPGLISKFGGHAMAAGLTLPRAHLDAFRQAFDQAVATLANPEDLEPVLHSDGELADGDLDLPLAELLREAGPWGQGFPEPLFHGEFDMVDYRWLKEKHLKLSVRVTGSHRLLDAIAFNADRDNWSPGWERIVLAYRLDINEYRGRRNLQLMVQYLQPAAS